jgi:hypothetical protein
MMSVDAVLVRVLDHVRQSLPEYLGHQTELTL